MKHIIYVFAFCFSFSTLFAQINTTVPIKEEARLMSKGMNNSFTIVLKGANSEEVEEMWEKMLDKKYDGKTKKNKKSKEIFTDNAKIEDMSTNKVDVYAVATPIQEGTELTVWFDLGGAYLNRIQHPERYPAAEFILSKIALETSKAAVKADLKEQKSILKDMAKEYSSLQKEERKLKSEIEEMEEKLAKARQELSTTLANQEAKQEQIKAQEKSIENVQQQLRSLE